MTQKLTLPTVRKVMREVVKDFGPQHTVRQCIYFEPDYAAPTDESNYAPLCATKPVCIVGQVFARTGHMVARDSNYSRPGSTGVPMTEPAREFLHAAQYVQDGNLGPRRTRAPWGEAFDVANNPVWRKAYGSLDA